jgi:hypothetical protein
MVTFGFASQLSVAVGFATVGTDPHSTVTFGGTPLKTGAELSITEMCCVALLVFPQASLAVHVRVSI